MWFKTGLKILNYTQNNESLSKRSDFTVLTQLQSSLLSYKQSSQKQAEQTPESRVCMGVHLLISVILLACICVFVCSGKSGVWILSSCLSDRKAGSVKQSGQQHQSAICLISAVLHIPSNTEVHICLCAPGLYALTQTVFTGLHTTHMKQTPI